MSDQSMVGGLIIGLVVIIFERIVSGIASYFQNKNKSEKDITETLIKYGERFTMLSEKVDSIVRLKDDYSILFRRLEKLEDKLEHIMDKD